MVNLIKVRCDDGEVFIEGEGKITTEESPKKVSVSESIQKTILSFEKISDTIKTYCKKQDLTP